MRIASPAHALFAAILIALGIQGWLRGDFTAIWDPVAKGAPFRALLVHATALVSLGAGLGLLGRRTAGPAATLLLASLLFWILAWRVPVLVRAPLAILSWDNAAETVGVAAGACILHAWFARNASGLRAGRALWGLALIPFGLAHLAFVKETASLVPAWIPAHVALAYATGATFLLAGLAILIGVRARAAAALSALQIGLFTLLVWVPILAKGAKGTFEWNELALSAVLTAAGGLVAESYAGAW